MGQHGALLQGLLPLLDQSPCGPGGAMVGVHGRAQDEPGQLGPLGAQPAADSLDLRQALLQGPGPALSRVAAGGTAIDPEVVAQLFTRSARTPASTGSARARGTYSP
jgi:hypothetical protein